MQEICRKYGIVFIADEVQSGSWANRKILCHRTFGVEPDLITTAKSLGGGLPIGAITGRAEIMDAPGSGRAGKHVRGQSGFLRGCAGGD